MPKASILVACAILTAGCAKHIVIHPTPTPLAGHSVHLSWTASTTAGAAYNIYRKGETCTGSAAFTKINSAPVNTLAYDDLNMADGTYCYQVTAYLSTSTPPESAPSNRAEAIINPPSPPANLTVSPAVVTVNTGGRQQFLALRGDTAVPATWVINPQEGTIDATGVYLAPASIKGNNIQVRVVASENSESAAADMTLRK